ncbi:nicotinate-nucleotide adenylyltransferase [soil metagenome]
MKRSFPLNCSKLGLLGGSFDPIHVGHLIVAEILAYRLDLDHVVFLPAANPPHKPTQEIAPGDVRLEMIRRSIDGVSGFSVSEVDLRRPGPSYTADSLAEIRDAVSENTQLYFLMGMDSLRDFPGWHKPDRVAGLARLGIARRPGVDVSRIDIERQVPEARGRIDIVNVPLIDISSSDIRDRARSSQPFRFQVVPAVAKYIIETGLYRDSQ